MSLAANSPATDPAAKKPFGNGNLLPLLRKERLRPIYLLVGDEIFFRDRFRQALVELLVPPELREFSLFDEDLASTALDDLLARARNASLMAPVQVFFVRNVKELFGRGSGGEETGRGKKKHGAFPDNLAAYARDPNPGSVLVFLADHVHIPANIRRINLDDKTKLERLQTVFAPLAEIIQCARVGEAQGARIAIELAREQGFTLEADAAQLLFELLDGDLGLVQSEASKLGLYAQESGRVGRELILSLVSARQQRSGFDLARAMAADHRAEALACLHNLWLAGGDGDAIGLVAQLARNFKMALILRQRRVRDRGAIYSVLPEGLRPPGFAADDLLLIAQKRREAWFARAIVLLQHADVSLRSNPVSMRLVLEQVIFELTAAPAAEPAWRQLSLASPG